MFFWKCGLSVFPCLSSSLHCLLPGLPTTAVQREHSGHGRECCWVNTTVLTDPEFRCWGWRGVFPCSSALTPQGFHTLYPRAYEYFNLLKEKVQIVQCKWQISAPVMHRQVDPGNAMSMDGLPKSNENRQRGFSARVSCAAQYLGLMFLGFVFAQWNWRQLCLILCSNSICLHVANRPPGFPTPTITPVWWPGTQTITAFPQSGTLCGPALLQNTNPSKSPLLGYLISVEVTLTVYSCPYSSLKF